MIQLKNIVKKYDDKVIFDNLSLEIKSGEFVGIFGESGKGKSTLLNIIGTLESPDRGEMIFMDKLVISNKLKRMLLKTHIGFIFQNYALIDNESVYENLKITLKHKKMDKTEKDIAINTVLDKVNLSNYNNKKIHMLSGGEQQRIAIARLILKDPTLILADEPTGSLDSENRDIIISLFKELHQQGKTIIIVTHDNMLSAIFSRIIKL